MSIVPDSSLPEPRSADHLKIDQELENFQDIARYLLPLPGELPRLRGIDVYGGVRSLNGLLGGDHLIYVDFKQRFDLAARIRQAERDGRADMVANLERCAHAAGIALVDVAGHRMTDALLTAMLHQAFLLGAAYELDTSGRITKHLFENLNTRFYQSSAAHKFITLLYGEISEDARFRFLSAGHPFPTVFSAAHDRFMDVSEDRRMAFPPLGLQPLLSAIDREMLPASALGFKGKYETNEWQLMGRGDILLMHTDGLIDHARGDEPYFPGRLEQTVRRAKGESARAIYQAIMDDVVTFAPPADDVSIVVVKLV
jgi:serine phosphatase RsbU (regulator of sigma subunit)